MDVCGWTQSSFFGIEYMNHPAAFQSTHQEIWHEEKKSLVPTATNARKEQAQSGFSFTHSDPSWQVQKCWSQVLLSVHSRVEMQDGSQTVEEARNIRRNQRETDSALLHSCSTLLQSFLILTQRCIACWPSAGYGICRVCSGSTTHSLLPPKSMANNCPKL